MSRSEPTKALHTSSNASNHPHSSSNDTATPVIYSPSLLAELPISHAVSLPLNIIWHNWESHQPSGPQISPTEPTKGLHRCSNASNHPQASTQDNGRLLWAAPLPFLKLWHSPM